MCSTTERAEHNAPRKIANVHWDGPRCRLGREGVEKRDIVPSPLKGPLNVNSMESEAPYAKRSIGPPPAQRDSTRQASRRDQHQPIKFFRPTKATNEAFYLQKLFPCCSECFHPRPTTRETPPDGFTQNRGGFVAASHKRGRQQTLPLVVSDRQHTAC